MPIARRPTSAPPDPTVVLTTPQPALADALVAVPLQAGRRAADELRAHESWLGPDLAERIGPREPKQDEGAAVALAGRPRLALVGVGADPDDDAVRAAAAAAADLARDCESTLAWLFDPGLLTPERQVRAVIEGVVLGGYDPARWKTTARPRRIGELVIAGAPPDLAPAAARIADVARWTNRARELVDAPPNELTPAGLADATAALLQQLPVEIDVLDAGAIEQAGLGALATVGRGSVNPPRLIVLRYRAAAGRAGCLGLVGKGVTFDSGGFFLKPQNDIVRQKADMAGAAAVIAAVGAAAQLELELDLLAVVPAAENMLGGAAYRPSDIITTGAGITVEVTNPDAEGRLILADAIWYAKQAGVTHLVDVATLTGAMRAGMGDLYSGVFANEVAWRDQIVAAGDSVGDHAWPWPLHRRYDQPLESKIADIRNTAGRSFGYPIFAAAFLSRFAGTTPWAHIDIHSTALLDEKRGYLDAGATGAGVRLLTALAERFAATVCSS